MTRQPAFRGRRQSCNGVKWNYTRVLLKPTCSGSSWAAVARVALAIINPVGGGNYGRTRARYLPVAHCGQAVNLQGIDTHDRIEDSRTIVLLTSLTTDEKADSPKTCDLEAILTNPTERPAGLACNILPLPQGQGQSSDH